MDILFEIKNSQCNLHGYEGTFNYNLTNLY